MYICVGRGHGPLSQEGQLVILDQKMKRERDNLKVQIKEATRIAQDFCEPLGVVSDDLIELIKALGYGYGEEFQILGVTGEETNV